MSIQSTYLKELDARLSVACERATALAGGMDVDALNWQPGADKWSIAQCLEHTLIAADDYLGVMKPAVDRARAAGRTANGDIAPRHSFIGKMIIGVVEPTVKRTVPAPKGFKPSQSEIGADILERFTKSHRNVSEMIGEIDGLDFNGVKFGTPEVKLIRVNLGDGLEILVSHAERHIGQAERVRDTDGFPG